MKTQYPFMFCVVIVLIWGASEINAIEVCPTDTHQPSGYTANALFKKEGVTYAPGEVLVVFHRSMTETEVIEKAQRLGGHEIVKVNARRRRQSLMPDIYRIRFDSTIDVNEIVALLQKDTHVRLVEPNYLVYPHSDDPLFPYQWHLRNTGLPYFTIKYNDLGQAIGQAMRTGTQGADIKAPGAWRHEVGDSEVVVAVLDTGVDIDHRDFKNRIWVNNGEVPGDSLDNDGNGYVDDIHGFNFCVLPANANIRDVVGHGTHVAGEIAAMTGNGTGVAGTAFNTNIRIMVVKFLGPNTTNENTIEAITYAVDNGAHILSNSWGGEYSKILGEAIDYALLQGRHFVASAGNYSIDVGAFSPAGNPGVFTVAATNSDDVMAPFSNYGKNVAVSAPGVDILSLRALGRDFYEDGFHIVEKDYYFASGTSTSCPLAAAVMAMVKAKYPQLPFHEIENIVKYSSDDTDQKNPIFSGLMGVGRINALRALTIIPGPYLKVERMRILDQSGDGVLLQGEMAILRMSVKNHWHMATDIQAELSADSDYISIISDHEWADVIDTNQTHDFLFTIRAREGAPDKMEVMLKLTFSYDQGNSSSYANIGIAPPFQIRDIVSLDGPITGTPVVEDIGGDGTNDIIVATESMLHVLDSEGVPQAGWPVPLPAPAVYYGVAASPAVGDIDGDGIVEVVYVSSDGFLNVLDTLGCNIPGFPVSLPGTPYNSSAVIADMDRDGYNDIIVCSAPWLIVYNHYGQVQTGWEEVNIWTAINTPSVADINMDGWLEIVTGNMFGFMFVFDHQGGLVPDWGRMVDPLWISPSVAIADLVPGNGMVEIAYSSVWTGVYVWDAKGYCVAEWPINLGPGELNYNYSPSLLVDDLDRDGKPEIFVAKGSATYALMDEKGGAKWDGGVTGGGIFVSPITANVDADRQLEIIMPYWNWQDGLGGTYLRIFKANGSDYYHQKMFGMAKHVLAADLDGDGRTELLVTNAMDQIYIIDTIGDYDPTSWNKFKGNNRNTGYIQSE